jgi:hypothetical protein
LSGSGDRYQSAHAGLNYLLYEHKLKLMIGLEYFDMSGVITGNTSTRSENSVDGWSFFTGLRLYF